MFSRIFVLVISFFFTVTGFAQGIFETAVNTSGNREEAKSPVLSGYARGSAWGGSRLNDFQAVYGELALKAKLSAGRLFLSGDIRFREGIFFGERKSNIEIKESYAGYHGNSFDILLGNQIVTWGRTDGFNPTDNICPKDYFFLSAEPDDQKLPNFMVRAKAKFSPSAELELIGIPVYRPSVYRYDFFDMGDNASFAGLLLPGAELKNGTLAARLNFEIPGAGFSFSWFHGFDPFYGFKIDSVSLYPSTKILYRPAVYKKNAIGADFAVPVKGWILRGEAAVTLTKDYTSNIFIPNPDFSYVVGIEHDLVGFNTIIQYTGKSVFRFSQLTYPVLSDPSNPLAQMAYAKELIEYESSLFNRKIFNQQEKGNHAVSVMVSRRFAKDIINIELTGYYNITSGDMLIRSSLKWNVSDALSAFAGFSVMDGPGKSVFENAGKVLNGVFLGLSASF